MEAARSGSGRLATRWPARLQQYCNLPARRAAAAAQSSQPSKLVPHLPPHRHASLRLLVVVAPVVALVEPHTVKHHAALALGLIRAYGASTPMPRCGRGIRERRGSECSDYGGVQPSLPPKTDPCNQPLGMRARRVPFDRLEPAALHRQHRHEVAVVGGLSSQLDLAACPTGVPTPARLCLHLSLCVCVCAWRPVPFSHPHLQRVDLVLL